MYNIKNKRLFENRHDKTSISVPKWRLDIKRNTVKINGTFKNKIILVQELFLLSNKLSLD